MKAYNNIKHIESHHRFLTGLYELKIADIYIRYIYMHVSPGGGPGYGGGGS